MKNRLMLGLALVESFYRAPSRKEEDDAVLMMMDLKNVEKDLVFDAGREKEEAVGLA